MLGISVLLVLPYLALSSAQNIPTSVDASTLATQDAQWVASGFDQALPNSNSFGVPLEATAELTIVYPNNVQVQNGQALTASQVAQLPSIYVTPASGSESAFAPGNLFTLMLADASAAGGEDTAGDYRHYLANSVPGATETNGYLQLNGGDVITQYAGPGPLPNSGSHRYAWMLFQQPSSFAAPANLSSSTPAAHWDVESYVDSTHLGNLVAASWFTVSASGTPTFSAIATSSTSVASAAVSTPAGSGTSSVAATSSTPSASPTSSKSAAPALSTISCTGALLVSVIAITAFQMMLRL